MGNILDWLETGVPVVFWSCIAIVILGMIGMIIMMYPIIGKVLFGAVAVFIAFFTISAIVGYLIVDFPEKVRGWI